MFMRSAYEWTHEQRKQLDLNRIVVDGLVLGQLSHCKPSDVVALCFTLCQLKEAPNDAHV